MYRIVGADGRQYGPVSTEQLQRWIVEGRANAQTYVLPEGAAEWKPLGTLPEFAASFATSFGRSTPPPVTPVSGSHMRNTNSMAVWGMICGLLSLVCCCCCCVNFPLGVLGLIFSLVGLAQINDRPDLYAGRGFAIAGIVVSALGIIICIVLMVSNAANSHYHQYYNWNYNRWH